MPPRTKFLVPALLALCLAACQPNPGTHPVPSVIQIGADLHCTAGDNGFEDQQVGWGFCYPSTWRYIEHSQGYQPPHPPELDLTFDITDIPCTTPSAPPGQPSPHPICSPNAGLFAYMIVSTFDRGGAADLASWVQANVKPIPVMQPITWGNSVEAAKFADGRRIALTPQHVVILELHSGVGLLDLETEMSARLDTWKFLI